MNDANVSPFGVFGIPAAPSCWLRSCVAVTAFVRNCDRVVRRSAVVVCPFAAVTRFAPASLAVRPHVEMLAHTVRAQPAGVTFRGELPAGTAALKFSASWQGRAA